MTSVRVRLPLPSLASYSRVLKRPSTYTCRPLLRNCPHVSASFPKATTRNHSVRSCLAPLRSVKRSVLATEKFATFCPALGRERTTGSAPRLPITITLLTAIFISSIWFLFCARFPFIGQGVCLPFVSLVRSALSVADDERTLCCNRSCTRSRSHS